MTLSIFGVGFTDVIDVEATSYWSFEAFYFRFVVEVVEVEEG